MPPKQSPSAVFPGAPQQDNQDANHGYGGNVKPLANVGSTPLSADLQIPRHVWDNMGPSARKTAAKAASQRALLADLPLLQKLGGKLTVAEAQALGVTVLGEEGDHVSMGTVQLPRLDNRVQFAPKSFHPMTEQPDQLLLLPQRLELANGFVCAVQTGMRSFGVLLSGPNGVGKSGVGLLSYLLCVARRLPVVYLNRTETWIEKATESQGDAYLLGKFWEQNADLIAASPPLSHVFARALRDEEGAFTPQVMDALRHVALEHDLGVGVIMDEVQHITAVVQASGATALPGKYFRNNWHDWMNDNCVFVRMSIASAHGERDYKLPSGEEHRLRIVEPLTDGQRDALLTHEESPTYVEDANARERIVPLTGNVLRPLMTVAKGLPTEKAALKAELRRRLNGHRRYLLKDCLDWLATLTVEQRKQAAKSTMDLLTGQVSWVGAKGLYDAGVMYRTAESHLLCPVSLAAESAYLTATAEYVLKDAKPLSSYTDGRQRGFALEQQVLACLATGSARVGTKHLDGKAAPDVFLGSSFAQRFEGNITKDKIKDQMEALKHVVQCEEPVLYIPQSLTFPCDGILMPAADDDDALATKQGLQSVLIIECSTSNPRESDRMKKLRKYFQPDGVFSLLRQKFPELQVKVVLVHDQDLEPAEVDETFTRDVLVWDRASLEMLQLVL